MSTSKEIPLQPDMFSGELADTRTARQKRDEARAERRAARAASLPPPLFSGQETILFGVTSANPALPFAPASALIGATRQDCRTPEEIAQDTQREAEKRTYALFPSEPHALIVRPDYLPVAVCVVDFSQHKEKAAHAPLLLTAGTMPLLLAAGEPVSVHAHQESQIAEMDEDAALYVASQALRLPFPLA